MTVSPLRAVFDRVGVVCRLWMFQHRMDFEQYFVERSMAGHMEGVGWLPSLRLLIFNGRVFVVSGRRGGVYPSFRVFGSDFPGRVQVIYGDAS